MAVRSVLGFRTIRRRFTRFALTALGVALGVGVLFSVLITNATIDEGLDRLVRQSDVPTVEIQPAGGYAAELPAAVVDTAARLPSVIDVSGGTGVYLRIPNAPREREGVYLNGGFLRDGPALPPKPTQHAGDIIVSGRVAGDDKDEVVLSEAVATQLRARTGSTVELEGPTGPVRLLVVGLNVRRDGQPGDDRAASTSYATARRLVGRGDVINYGHIRLAEGTDLAGWLADHGEALGPSIQLVSSAIYADSFKEVLSTGKAALAGLAGVALFVSGFLIFLTLSMSVAEAASVHGTLRAIGASRAQIRRTVLSDALALVALATPAGLVFGVLAATVTIRITRSVYGLPNLPMTVPVSAAVTAVVVGVLVTLVAALLPAQRAAMVAPVVAIRGSQTERRGAGRMWLVGLGAIAAGLLIVFAWSQTRVDLGSSLILFGAVLVVPAIMGPVAAIAGAATRRMARGVGQVGVLHLRKEPRRSAYTLALVMVVLAMVFTTGSVHLSLRRNLATTLSRQFPADLGIFAGSRLDTTLQEQITSTPGVAATTPIWFTRTDERAPIVANLELTVLDPASFFRVQGVSWAEGSDRLVGEALSRGHAVAVPQGLARRQHLRRGSVITLDTRLGQERFVVAGVYRAFQTRSPLLIGVSDGNRAFGIGPPNLIAASVAEGHRPAAVKAALERASTDGALFVQLTSEQKADFIKGQTQFFNLVYALVLIAVVMGMLGVTNTLAMAVLRRTREIGILRAVGTERRQLRRMALVEATTIGLTGLVLAIPLGLVLSVTVLQTVTRTLDTVVAYVFPWPMFAAVAPLALLVAVLSSVIPGRHAARVDPARVLRFD